MFKSWLVVVSLFAVSSPAFAGDTRTTSSDTLSDTEIYCDWVGDADTDAEYVCTDFYGNPVARTTITCGDGTVIVLLENPSGNGCNSAQGINECRGHRGCVSLQ